MDTYYTDVLIVGAGAGGICAAVAASRAGAKTLLIEKNDEIGGTGVFSPLGILCGVGPTATTNVNLGFLPELYPHLYPTRKRDNTIPYYDAQDLSGRYQALVEGESNLTIWTSTAVSSCEAAPEDPSSKFSESQEPKRRILKVLTSGAKEMMVYATVFIDSTFNGDLSVLAGADFCLGREEDGKMQPGTLTFIISGVDATKLVETGDPPLKAEVWEDRDRIDKALGLSAAYRRLKETNLTDNPKDKAQPVLFFCDENVTTLVFNHTRITGVDPTMPNSIVEARTQAEKQIYDLYNAIKSHPALKNAQLKISPMFGVREGRRIVGDYILTKEDCLGEVRFDDMVAACCYEIDIHSPQGNDTQEIRIPGSGYYHIPYRSIRARGFKNLLMGSRCISGTHEAHSSYRVMAPVTAIGQAAGVAAALVCRYGLGDVREISPAKIRSVLLDQNQFVEGSIEPL